jgi:aminopeptidase
LKFYPSYKAVQADQLVDSKGCMLAFMSHDEPDLYADLSPDQQSRLNEMLVARREATRRMRDEGVLQRAVSWCGAGAVSPNWAAKVFPDLSGQDAIEALWADIFRMTFADQEDCSQLWAQHLDTLAWRARQLNQRALRKLRFLNLALGTDLEVTLSEKARWVSGSTTTASGISVCLNIPTYEVFTTPDWRGTEGTVAITRPVMINGSLVEGLRLRFEHGEIVQAEATRNLAAYQALIDTAGDATARRLGEVALVGVDSPIYQSGRLYQHTLYDENAACHIATGMAYTVGLDQGDRLAAEELDALGCNRNSRTHQDIMISDDQTTVLGDGQELLVRGRWVF